MTTLLRATFTLLVSILILASLRAQVPPGTGGQISGDKGSASAPQKGQGKLLQAPRAKLWTAVLLMNPKVQQELQLSKEQLQALRSVFEELRAIKAQGKGEGEASLALQQAQAKAESVLTEKQLARLRQLALQQQGPMALARPDIAKEVGLSDAQLREIHGILLANAEELRKIKGSGQKPDMQMLEQRRKEIGEKVLAVLDTAQQAKWKELLGPPFDFKKK